MRQPQSVPDAETAVSTKPLTLIGLCAALTLPGCRCSCPEDAWKLGNSGMTGGDACRGSGGNLMLAGGGGEGTDEMRQVAAVMKAELTCGCDDPNWVCGYSGLPETCPAGKQCRECWVFKVQPSDCCREAAERVLQIDGGAELLPYFYYSPPQDPCYCDPNWATTPR